MVLDPPIDPSSGINNGERGIAGSVSLPVLSTGILGGGENDFPKKAK
jgi:hypothetical protein